MTGELGTEWWLLKWASKAWMNGTWHEVHMGGSVKKGPVAGMGESRPVQTCGLTGGQWKVMRLGATQS